LEASGQILNTNNQSNIKALNDVSLVTIEEQESHDRTRVLSKVGSVRKHVKFDEILSSRDKLSVISNISERNKMDNKYLIKKIKENYRMKKLQSIQSQKTLKNPEFNYKEFNYNEDIDSNSKYRRVLNPNIIDLNPGGYG